MADFYGCLESTSFRVKDVDAFLADPEVAQLSAYAKQYGFFDREGDYFSFGWYGEYPSPVITQYVESEEGDTEKEIDVLLLVGRHILPGGVCQIGVSGNEKLRYIGGGLWWITSKGNATFDGCTEWGTKLTTDHLIKFSKTFKSEVYDITR